jgi:hypothetical protein
MEKSSRAVSLQAGPFLQHFWPSPSLQSRPAPFSSPGHCQAGPGVLQTPHVSPSPSRVETVTHPTRYGSCYPPIPVPLLCSSPHCPPMKFQPCPTPRCSIQASVSCPSHPFACRLVKGPLASHIPAEASCRPAVSVDCCHRRRTAAMPVTTPRAAPLLPNSLLAPRAAPSSLQLPSPALRHVGTMRWHAHACHLATTSHPLSHSPPRQRRTDKRPPRCLHTRPLPL